MYLMLHQKEGIEFLKSNPRALLADEAGLGKSRQVIEAAKLFIKGRMLLILCPTSVVENWKVELEKWGFPPGKSVVIGYEYQFLHTFKDLVNRKWGVIVADECQYLKNWSAQRTKLFMKLIKGRDSKVWMLSGTPMLKGAMDLHPILSFIQPGVWGKYKDFCEEFCHKKPDQWSPNGVKYYGVKNGSRLNARIKEIMIRRYKTDVIEDLPDKLFSDIPFNLGAGNFDVFSSDSIIRAVISAVERGGDAGLEPEVLETLQQVGLKKVEHVVKFCEDTLFPHPLVIFGHHRLVLYDIAERLKEKGRKVHVLVGGMDKATKHKYVGDFQAGIVDDIVCSIGVGGVGINLFRSSRCVFAEFPWTWGALEQAADRLHRIGQKDCVNVYSCYAKGTFEEKQLRAIEERKNMTVEVLGI